MSPVFDCSSEAVRREGLAKAAEAVREGKLVVLPTDTLYGVGADAFNRDAVASLLAAKGRGRQMPPPVLVGDVRTLDGLAIDVPDFVHEMVAAFWPGPLTVILKAQPSLSWDLGDTNGTVALRMPDNDIALALLQDVGPMAVSSANQSGWPAARTMVDAATQLGSAVFIYLDGGSVGGGLASTIVDCTTMPPTILREGAVSLDQLATYFPEPEPEQEQEVAETDSEVLEPASSDAEPRQDAVAGGADVEATDSLEPEAAHDLVPATDAEPMITTSRDPVNERPTTP